MARTGMTVATGLAAVLAAATPGAAQEMAAGSGWQWSGTLYGWLPGIDTTTGTDRGSVDSDVSTQDVIESLAAVFMGSFGGQYGRWSLVVDGLYANLSTDKDTPFGLLFKRADIELKMTAVTGWGMYRVAETPRGSLDLGVGVRWFDVDVTTDLRPGVIPTGESFNQSGSWAVPLVAARGRVALGERWFGKAVGDWGNDWNGDDETWQALLAVGYDLGDSWSLEAGYRWMWLQKELDGEPLDLKLSGPAIGITGRF